MPEERLSVEEVWGKCVLWQHNKETAEIALKTAAEQLAHYMGLLAIGEGQYDPEA